MRLALVAACPAADRRRRPPPTAPRPGGAMSRSLAADDMEGRRRRHARPSPRARITSPPASPRSGSSRRARTAATSRRCGSRSGASLPAARARRWSTGGADAPLSIPGDIFFRIVGRAAARSGRRAFGLHRLRPAPARGGHDDFAGVDLRGKIAVVIRAAGRRELVRRAQVARPRRARAAARASAAPSA